MISRKIEAHIKYLAGKFPVITITGPRQSGKTSVAKKLFSHNRAYVNLESYEERAFATSDPNAFLAQFPDGAILDEVQNVPELFSYIQVLLEGKKEKGFFILTGSQQFNLLDSISQSLAGRTAIVKLLPFSLEEIKEADFSEEQLKICQQSQNWEEYLYRGFYPRIYHENIEANFYYDSYIATYLERDLRSLSSVQDLEQFRKFMQLCAVRIGQGLNYKNIADDLGVSPNTVKQWINLLVTSYIIFLLPPYHTNIKKRLVKSPKLYFYDVGLASSLLNINKPEHARSHPLFGSLFENLVILEALKYRFNRGQKSNFYFYGDSEREVDLLSENGSKLDVFEIKSSQTIHDKLFSNLFYLQKTLPALVEKKVLIYAGDKNQTRTDSYISNPWDFHGLINN